MKTTRPDTGGPERAAATMIPGCAYIHAAEPAPLSERDGRPDSADGCTAEMTRHPGRPYAALWRRMISRIEVPRGTSYIVPGKSRPSWTAHNSSCRLGENSWAGRPTAIQPIGTTESGGR